MSRNSRRKDGQRKLEAVVRAQGGTGPEARKEPTHYPRNRLVSKLLQDRSVLRVICAPRGYGKTSLAHEYADRLFTGRAVRWVDASVPSFLADLDRWHAVGFDGPGPGESALIVLDDVPWLHEERAATLAKCIDAFLEHGTEVLATTLPSCDCLSSLQAERVFVSAADLEITEQECLDGQDSEKSIARVHALRMWRGAKSDFMGRVPAVAWGEDEGARSRVLEWFFEEKLSLEVLRASVAIAILGEGPLALLGATGFTSRGEDVRILARDYPFLGIDPAHDQFSVACASIGTLSRALAESGATGLVRGKSGRFTRDMLGILLQRGQFSRAEEVLNAFCTDTQCAQWLLDCGWELLDKGEFELVDSLLGRCPDEVFASSSILQVLRAWDSGLLGDGRESAFYAQRVLRTWSAEESREDERQQAVGALAYLALVAFAGKGASIYAKTEFSSALAPVTAEGFLARTVDFCSDVELERALAPDRDGARGALEKMREPAEESRAKGLYALFTQNEDRLKGNYLYRLAFHLLCYVDSDALKPVVLGIGCELMARSRRNGISSCSEALVVRDLWERGFFGSAGSAAKRDAEVFEGAARILRKMHESSDEGQADIPWEIESHLSSRGGARGPRPAKKAGDVDMLSIRLFGSFEATVGGRCIKEGEWRKKSKLLVILLVLNSGRDVSRDTLFTEIWPGLSRVRALDNFYSAWSVACALFGNGPYIERQESFCRVNTRYVVSDVAEFEKLVRRLLTEHPDTNTLLDMYARIEALYRGGLVPSETENRTINAQRVRYQAMYVDAMIAATDCSLKANDARLALWFARKGMETGQQREDLYEALARAQVAGGQRCSAIKTYFQCKEYLRENLGLDPSYDMQDLYDKLISVDPSLLKLTPSSFQKG